MRIRASVGRLIIVVGLVLVSGCVMRRDGSVAFAPIVVQPYPPAPVVVAPPVYAPEAYVWDGYEYVGWYGNQYMYLGPSGWLVCDGVVLERFHGWAHNHSEYRRSAFRYDRNHPPTHRGNENHGDRESEHR